MGLIPARALDALIAEHVLGTSQWDIYDWDLTYDGQEESWFMEGVADALPAYSTDLAAAQAIVDRLGLSKDVAADLSAINQAAWAIISERT